MHSDRGRGEFRCPAAAGIEAMLEGAQTVAIARFERSIAEIRTTLQKVGPEPDDKEQYALTKAVEGALVHFVDASPGVGERELQELTRLSETARDRMPEGRARQWMLDTLQTLSDFKTLSIEDALTAAIRRSGG